MSLGSHWPVGNVRDVQRNQAVLRRLDKSIRQVRDAVAANAKGIEGIEDKVDPRLEKFDQKFESIDRNFQNIINEIDEKDEETKDVYQNISNLKQLREKVETQGQLLEELREKAGGDFGEQLKLVKIDFINLKQEVFDLQENEKQLKSECRTNGRRGAAGESGQGGAPGADQ